MLLLFRSCRIIRSHASHLDPGLRHPERPPCRLPMVTILAVVIFVMLLPGLSPAGWRDYRENSGESVAFDTCVDLIACARDRVGSPEAVDEPDPDLSGTEIIFGTGNVDGVSGNGSMACGFAPEGELTVLKWPSPSFYDQVSYQTPSFLFEDTGAWRAIPYNGAAENAGCFAGIHYRTGEESGISWFRARELDDGMEDENPCDDWEHAVYYSVDYAPVLVSEAVNESLGIRVTCYNVVLPNDPSPFDRNRFRGSVLMMYYEIERYSGSPVESAELIFFENLEPCNRKIPAIPMRDYFLDRRNDFAALYHSDRGEIVHFRPECPDYWRLIFQPHHTQQDIDELIEGLDMLFPNSCPFLPDGVFLTIGAVFNGTDFLPQGHQVGLQYLERPHLFRPQGAYWDALDGDLSGNSFATDLLFPLASGALSNPLLFDEEGRAEAVVYIACAHTESMAHSLVERAREHSPETHLDRTLAWWEEWMDRAALPSPDLPDSELNGKIVEVSKRSLVNIMVGYDKATGATIAAVSTQSPYGEDWPRDGAFFNHALDRAGFHGMVTRRLTGFYRGVQRGCGEAVWFWKGMRYPLDLEGTFEMNYYSDGTVGGPIFFEIDNTGLLVWSMWDHYGFLQRSDREAGAKGIHRQMSAEEYLEEIYPAICMGAGTLARCRDVETGLQCTAFEDDNFVPSRTLHGAITVWLALDSAIRASGEAERLGIPVNPEEVAFWLDRREELGDAIREYFLDAGEGHFSGGGAGAWLIWPACFLDPDDPLLDSHGQYLFDGIAPHLNMDTDGSSYNAKITLALAKAAWDGTASGYLDFDLEDAQAVLMTEVPTSGTLQYGEVFVTLDTDGDGERDFFDNRTDIPHIWEGALNYLAAITLWPPEGP